jgi:hypothetical protein
MLLAPASALAAQSVPPQPEARAIEAAQAEIEALFNGGGFEIIREATPGRRDRSRRAIVATRHPRHCVTEMQVRFLEHPLGSTPGSPQRFDWSELQSGGSRAGSRVSYTLRAASVPETVPAAVREISRAEQRAPRYFLAPDAAKAARLAQATRALVRYCAP